MKSKRHVLLLEVLIALMLVTLCLLPLIYPHIESYKAQKKQIELAKNNHNINQQFADLVEDLYLGKVDWKEDERFTVKREKKVAYVFTVNLKGRKFEVFAKRKSP